MNCPCPPVEIVRRPLFFPLLILIFLILTTDFGQSEPIDPVLLYQKSVFTGTIAESPRIKDGFAKIKVKIPEGLIQITVPADENFFRKGDVITFPARLKEPHSFKNPGGFDYARYLYRQGIGATGFIENPENIRLVSRDEIPFWKEWILSVKKETYGILAREGSPQAQGVLIALLWGEERLLDESTRELFRNQGLSHLLVISGLHFAAVAWVLFWFFLLPFKIYPKSFLYLPARPIAAAATFFVLTGYLLFCESSPSVLRAYIAVSCYLAAIVINRSRDLLNILFLAAFLILISNPADLFNLSFQFSFVAVLSLVLIPPWLKSPLAPLFQRGEKEKRGEEKKKSWIRIKLADFVRVNVAIFLGLTPLIVFYFHEAQWNGPFMNIWAIPAIEFLAVPLGLLGLFLVPLSPALAAPLFWADVRVIEGILWILKKAGEILPPPSLVFPPHGWELLLYYVLVLLLVLAWPRPVKKAAFAILVVFLLDIGLVFYRMNYFEKVRITHLDVGQGDSLFIELPGAIRILIDTGGSAYFDTGENIVAPFLLHQRIPKIDVLCLTHAHVDHYGGAAFLIDHFDIGEIWWNGFPNEASAFKALIQKTDAKKIKSIVLRAGMERPMGEALFKVLGPSPQAAHNKDENEQSLVLKMTARGKTALFTGDISSLSELGMMEAWGDELDVDYLKVAHHGSKNSSAASFLRAVSPEIASVSAGFKSRFNHPHPKILERFKELGIPLYRTDLEGALRIELNGDFPRFELSTREAGLF
ncbi:MAG: DNA internalization-related competence protein ComEC/Rec2 [Deltaproteobacteria bacterium]|nr:DNA internalization-related competence protein ComEC/Rec2 [Deltaproteobacteria bacterium]